MRFILLVLLGSVSYGVLSTFVKLAYLAGFDVSAVTGSQNFFGTVLLWPLALLLRRGRGPAGWRGWLALLAVGAPIGLTGVFYYSSLHRVTASLAVVLLFQFTWIGVVAEAVIARRWPAWDRLVALALLLAGTALAAGVFEGDLGPLNGLGVVFGLLSAVSYATFIWCAGRVGADADPWIRSATMITGAFLVAGLVFPPTFILDGSLGRGLLPYGLALGLLGPVIPTVTFNTGVPRIGPGLASILGAAELPTAVLLSSVVLREHVSGLQWVGVAVILAGIALPELRRFRG